MPSLFILTVCVVVVLVLAWLAVRWWFGRSVSANLARRFPAARFQFDDVGTIVSLDTRTLSITEFRELTQWLQRPFGINLRGQHLEVRLEHADDEHLSALGSLAALGVLVCRSASSVTDSGLEHVRHLPSLFRLDLEGLALTDSGLTSLGQLRNLEELTVENAPVTDAGLKHLAGLNLDSLSLAGTRVAGPGLADLGGMTRLRSLDLCRTAMTDEGLAHLHTLAGLQSLDLSETQVTDAGLLHLEALRNLQDLTLQQTAVTDTGVDRLKAALRHQQPRLTILW